MRHDFSLLAAILKSRDYRQIEALLEESRSNSGPFDLIEYCSALPGLNDVIVMERAATWCGFAFVPSISILEPQLPLRQLEEIARIRSVRARILGRDVIWAAPSFAEFLALAGRLRRNPRLRRHLVIIPRRALRSALTAACAGPLLEQAQAGLAERLPEQAAIRSLSTANRSVFLVGLAVFLLLFGILPFLLSPLLIVPAGVFVMLPALLRLQAALFPVQSAGTPFIGGDDDWPIYSIIVPLRDEAHMVAGLAAAIRRMHYPPSRLEVMFAVEQTSPETVAAVRAETADSRFHLVEVPDGAPRTKPKALNYTLPLISGDFVAVYDAEDVPEPDQVQKAARRFLADPELACLQAELVVDNAGESKLTALFAGEYAGQFGLMLPLLVRWGLPIPLGGTSNHFRVESLRQVGGWDAHNVTEDADLGVRLARFGLRTATLDSATFEEAPVTLTAWLRQRTRWMKGWMQTYIVHGRQPRQLLKDLGPVGFLGFHIYVGSLIVSPPLHALFVAVLVLAVTGFSAALSGPWMAFAAISLAIGYGGPVVLAIAGLRRLGSSQAGTQLLLPVYWLLHAVAVIKAAVQLLRQPYFWARPNTACREREAAISCDNARCRDRWYRYPVACRPTDPPIPDLNQRPWSSPACRDRY